VATTITMNDHCSVMAKFVPDHAEEIWDWHDLNAVRDNLSGYYLLMNDLDADTGGYEELAGPAADEGKGWQPIGPWDPYGYPPGEAFRGTFDGQGYEIRDLCVLRPDESFVGLFGAIRGVFGGEQAVIEDIGLANATVVGNWSVGGLVGRSYELSTVRNSYATGNVTGWARVGGLAGANDGPVTDSCFVGDVTGSFDVGGLVGVSWHGSVLNSHATGNVTGGGSVGGLIGSTNYANVTNCHFTGTVSGNGAVGGLVGYNWVVVWGSYSAGTVTGESNVGGLVGVNMVNVINSYSSASVTGEWCAGGLVGSNQGSVSRAYSVGSVAGQAAVGGLVGINLGEDNVRDSFWDVEASGIEFSSGGTGKTTAEMKDIATFTDTNTEGLDEAWSMVAVQSGVSNPVYTWNIVDGQTYPFLGWQSVA
jgi:hypothetical protein